MAQTVFAYPYLNPCLFRPFSRAGQGGHSFPEDGGGREILVGWLLNDEIRKIPAPK